MSRFRTTASTGSILRAVLLTLLFIIIFLTTIVISLFVLVGPGLDLRQAAPEPNPTPTIEPEPLVTPVAGSLTTLRNVALGFAIDYPDDWRRQERTLRVVFSPTEAGLEATTLQYPALWVGIPADEQTEPTAVLTEILRGFPARVEVLETGSTTISGQNWLTARVRYESDQLSQPGRATLAATKRNEVGYVVVMQAPASQWDALQPIFQGMLNSFRFTAEAVIRPTEATRPPTPTPTPTPRIYVVQSGDTLSEIAVQFGVSTEALAARNSIDDPRSLRVGQKLIIPTRR
jgi:LysM repeat protein